MPFSQGEQILLLVILVCIALVWAFSIVSYQSLPDTIAAHFNAKGQVDRYDNKGLLFIMPAFLTLTTALLLILSRYPHIYNYPGKITEANAERQYRLGRQMILWVSLSIVAVFAMVEYLIVDAARNPERGPKIWLVFIMIGLTLLPVIYFIVRMSAKK